MNRINNENKCVGSGSFAAVPAGDRVHGHHHRRQKQQGAFPARAAAGGGRDQPEQHGRRGRDHPQGPGQSQKVNWSLTLINGLSLSLSLSLTLSLTFWPSDLLTFWPSDLLTFNLLNHDDLERYTSQSPNAGGTVSRRTLVPRTCWSALRRASWPTSTSSPGKRTSRMRMR